MNESRFKKELTKDLRNKANRALLKSVMVMYETAVSKVPYGKGAGSGNLMRAIRYEVDEANMSARLFVDQSAKYAEYVEYDTKAHLILPKNKQALAFTVGGSAGYNSKGQYKKVEGTQIVVKKVQHPGTTAQPFMRPSLWENKEKILKIFKQEFQA